MWNPVLFFLSSRDDGGDLGSQKKTHSEQPDGSDERSPLLWLWLLGDAPWVQTVVFSSRRAVRQTPVLLAPVSRAARRQPMMTG